LVVPRIGVDTLHLSAREYMHFPPVLKKFKELVLVHNHSSQKI
jgi:hypothetical protein